MVDSLNKENHHTHVSYVYRESFPSTENEGHTVYKLLFKITDHHGMSFYGLKFDIPPTERMVLKQIVRNEDIDTVALFMDISNLQSKLADYECGDLKFLFSSYGQKPTSALPYVYVGRNNNSVGANLLSRLSELNKEFVPVPEPEQVLKVCTKSNRSLSSNIADVNSSPSGTFNDFVNCIETGPPIKAIKVNCSTFTSPPTYYQESGSGSHSFMRQLVLVYNNGDGTHTDTEVFNNASFPDNVVKINVDQAATITFLSEDGIGTLNDVAWELITKDKDGNEIDSFGCGLTNDGARLTEAAAIADPGTYYRQVIPVIDFLGFSEVEENTAASTIIKFRLTRYLAP